jgi:aminoglycoside phosphotransferase (APT) family kinase protein
VTPAERAAEAARHFSLPGVPRVVGPMAGGLIHETWRIEAGGTEWVLQRLNRSVFHDVAGVMRNFAAVVAHLEGRLIAIGARDRHRRALALVPAESGRLWVEDVDGGAWRCTAYIAGTISRMVADSPTMAREAGRAFGAWTRLMHDFHDPLAMTLPGFHHTATRVGHFERAIARDQAARAAAVAAEIEILREFTPLAHVLPPLIAAGAIPTRAAHNDAKIANLLFDEGSGEALAVVDLDTVMPGSALHDVGDLIRSTVGTAAEDEPELFRMTVRPDYFAALVEGWFAGAGDVLTPMERELTLTAGRILCFEQAVRFLTDHLEGDRYYPIQHEGHNLDRARAQLALLLDLTARGEELEEIVARS